MSAVVSTSVRGAAARPGAGGDLQDLASWLIAGWGPPPAARTDRAGRQSRPASAAEARRSAST